MACRYQPYDYVRAITKLNANKFLFSKSLLLFLFTFEIENIKATTNPSNASQLNSIFFHIFSHSCSTSPNDLLTLSFCNRSNRIRKQIFQKNMKRKKKRRKTNQLIFFQLTLYASIIGQNSFQNFSINDYFELMISSTSFLYFIFSLKLAKNSKWRM